MRIAFTIPGAAAEAIQIDERSLFGHPGAFLDSQMVRRGKGWQCNVWADESIARAIRQACQDRVDMQGGEGFDDPPSWRRACRRAVHVIDVTLAGPYRS